MKVYFDASVIIAALLSPSGGSALSISLVQHKLVVGITSQTVIDEVINNSSKIHQPINSIHDFISETSLVVRSRLTEEEISPYVNKVAIKDAHVLAGAIRSHCDYLVTLDKKHLLIPSLRDTVPELVILSPKELLERVIQT